MHTLKVVGLLALNLGESERTFVAALIGLAYSPVGCNGTSIATLGPIALSASV